MKFKRLAACCAVTMAFSLAACSSVAVDSVAEVRQITHSAYCGLRGPGVAYVASAEDLEPLLGVSGQNFSTKMIREVDFASEHLVFVTLGQKPTAGFSVALDNVRFAGETLTLEMFVRKPEPDMIVAQVITSPCAIVAVPATKWQRLEIVGVTDKPLVRDLR
ncbi:protease complex subunit PrcB family protein [Marinobacter sp. F3R08]|uniref:protease complex subunit PrcB family protein n=1 Tax=Marinobacter sp. F3R08 TaxID=2841559 RepID=UPI001C09DC94|nr:protease complex subunit PrcB family protein [Marinobacter sp. F3R08]MBU2953933.1 protease complex subunit PrcB family protein [Marinobacter sp. F3R08]